MQPGRLLVFRAVARAGSLGKAARELGWTQPAVGQHMRALENEVGHPLLTRTSKGVQLTEAGQRLLTRADELAALLEITRDEQAEFDSLERGTVRIAAFGTAGATLIPAVVTQLRAVNETLETQMIEAEPEEALQLLAAGEVDIALVFRYVSEPHHDGRSSIDLGEEGIRLVVPKSSRLGTNVMLAQLANESWVAGCPRCSQNLRDVCRSAGFVPHVRHTTDDYVIVQNLVAAGVGVALLPATALQAFRHAGVAVVRDPTFGTRQVSAEFNTAAARTPIVAATLQALQRAAAANPDLR